MFMNEIPSQPSKLQIKAASLWKLFLIGGMILVLMIPVIWINTLIDERYNRRDSVTAGISSKWGTSQTIGGPFISVPYPFTVKETDEKGNERLVSRTRYLHLTPESLIINAKTHSSVQHRGIFKVPVYKAEVDFNCVLPATFETRSPIESLNLDWQNALVTFDLSDQIGLKELNGTFNGVPLKFIKSYNVMTVTHNANPAKPNRFSSSFSAEQVQTSDDSFKFQAALPAGVNPAGAKIKLTLALTGTKELSFLTSALKETVTLRGDWLSPSFTGDLLPDTRKVDKQGFTATWQTNYLNSGNRPSWTSDEPNLRLSTLGVNFLIMVDSYQQTTRALKYSILFLLLTFMTFFFTETTSRQRIHPIQYLMVGSSLIIFYLLLLSISEHLSFGWSYLIAASAVVLQISLYCSTMLRSKAFALRVGGILAAVYAFLFILLRLEDSALLVGSIALFVLLGIAMYVIRNVNWYNQE
jgi:inner membrane protein